MDQQMDTVKSKKSEMSISNSSLNGKQKIWLLGIITMGELLKPGMPVLSPEAREKLVDLYGSLLAEIGEDRFIEVYDRVLKTSKFRPDISELYESAGVQVLNPHHEAALADLKLVIDRLRIHGPKRDKSWVDVNDRSKGIRHADTLPEGAQRALLEVGWGDMKAGLAWVWQLPCLDSVREGDEELPFRSQDKLEARWVQAWIKAQKGQSGE